MGKINLEALPLLEAPSVVRLVHLQKLLCGLTVDCSSSSKASLLKIFFGQEIEKIRMEPCDGSFVAHAPVECGIWPTSVAPVGPRARVCCDVKTQQTAISWPLRPTASCIRPIAPK